MFTRDQFEPACRAFANRRLGWSWVPGHNPGYGFLTRITQHTRKCPVYLDSPLDLVEHNVEEVEDNAIAQQLTRIPFLNVHEYIVYSASFNVPAFYFVMQDSNGSPLPLHEILQTSLLKMKAPSGSQVTDFALTLPSGSFPLISHGEHPTLGIPCWYLHPCESETAVNEFMEEEAMFNWSQEQRFTRWLEIWLMIVGSVLNV